MFNLWTPIAIKMRWKFIYQISQDANLEFWRSYAFFKSFSEKICNRHIIGVFINSIYRGTRWPLPQGITSCLNKYYSRHLLLQADLILQELIGKTFLIPASYQEFEKLIQQGSELAIPVVVAKNNKNTTPIWWDNECFIHLSMRKETMRQLKANMSIDNYYAAKKTIALSKKIFKDKRNDNYRSFCASHNRRTPLQDI